ncbi:hypothetical protein [Castellaniella sp.]
MHRTLPQAAATGLTGLSDEVDSVGRVVYEKETDRKVTDRCAPE